MGFSRKYMTTRNNNIYRILAGLIMLGCVIWGYWWLVWSLAIIFLFIFPSYYEMIIWGVMYDALYGVSLMFSLASIGLFIISLYLKKRLFAYENF